MTQATLKRSHCCVKILDSGDFRRPQISGDTLWALNRGCGPGCPCGHCSQGTGQRRSLTFADKALDVEVLVLDPQHLALAHIGAGVTQDGCAGRLLQGAVSGLGLGHCREKEAALEGARARHRVSRAAMGRGHGAHTPQHSLAGRLSGDRLVFPFSLDTNRNRITQEAIGQPPAGRPVPML